MVTAPLIQSTAARFATFSQIERTELSPQKNRLLHGRRIEDAAVGPQRIEPAGNAEARARA